MKKTFFLAGLVIMSWGLAKSQFIAEVLEYRPAPGQTINTMPWGVPSSAESLIGGINGTLSLGSFGGYVIFRFEHPVENHPDNPFGIDFTIFGNPSSEWSEPGIVSVMKDGNGNGLADDTWYILAGSDSHFSSTIHQYEVTYVNPHESTASDVPWFDNLGKEGVVLAGSYYTQPYYPLQDSFPGIDSNSYSLSGLLIKPALDTSNIAFIKSFKRAFGFADNQLRGSPPYTLPDNPYTQERENSGGDAFDISWAIDTAGNYVDLDVIHFVRVHTGVLANAGWLGEISTDITGAVDVAPDTTVHGIEEMIVIADLPKQLDTTSYQLEPYVFHRGKLQTGKPVLWSTSKPEAVVDANHVLTVTASGPLEITATLADNPAIHATVSTTVHLPSSTSDLYPADLTIYPNPATDRIQITGTTHAQVHITDIMGKMVHFTENYQGNQDIRIADLSDGLYIVRIVSNNRIRTMKLIKETP